MDFQSLLDQFAIKTCVLSMETYPDGSYGNIRIVTGNKAYIDSIEHAPSGLGLEGARFIPNSPLERYFAKEPAFEDFIYRAAILKQPMHAYVHPERFPGIWIREFLLPLESDRENVGYCTFSNELSFSPDSEWMSNVSLPTASSVLSACIKLRGAADFKKAITEVVTDIRLLCGGIYCCILKVDEEKRSCALLGESLHESLVQPSEDAWLTDDYYSIVETWPDALAGSNCLIIKDERDMALVRQRSPIWYESLTATQVKSLVLFPLRFRETLLGYVWVSNFDTASTVRIKETMELMTFFIASEIASDEMLDKLREIGTLDQMTGLLNRNAMNDRMERLAAAEQPRPMGIVMADLNGLKRTNDLKGHRTGDIMLKKAAQLLRETFPTGEVCRAGGDEFVVLLPDITEAALEEQTARLQAKLAEQSELSLSVGCCHGADCRKAEGLMKAADERMYEDKKQYYLNHPQDSRRR